MLIETRENAAAIGRFLLRLARQSRVTRRFDLVEQISNLIIKSLPGNHFVQVANCYKAECEHLRTGSAETKAQLESAIDIAPARFRSSGLLNLACSYLSRGEVGAFAEASREALKASRDIDPLSEIQALRHLAVARAIGGDHRGSLSLLESLLPTSRALGSWYPADFYNHLNSVAMEMGEAGRTDEADRLIEIVLRSSFAPRYPEWHDTKLEIATKPRLIFAPFTMALGSPVEPVAESEPVLPACQNPSPNQTHPTNPASTLKITGRNLRPMPSVGLAR
ncbi:MAG: hypothetical protein ACREAC_07770, partial [Blastocatellia bacterium]